MSSQTESLSAASRTPNLRLKIATRLAGIVPNIDASQYTVVFTHIPKTGGTTLDHIVKGAAAAQGKRWRRLPMTAQLSIPRQDRKQTLLDLSEFSQDELRTYDYVTGHMPFGIHRLLPRQALYVVLLRDPVARLLSNVRFGIDREKWSRDTPLEPLFTEGKLVDNLQTRHISGVGDSGTPCTRAALDLALENLHSQYAVVGLTERFDDFLKALITLFGWPDIAYVDRQVTRTPSDPELEARVREATERYCSLDIELYAAARARATPWLAELFSGAVSGSLRQRKVLLTHRIVNFTSGPFTLFPAEVADSQLYPVVQRRGGDIVFV
jgi:hypothetical protein